MLKSFLAISSRLTMRDEGLEAVTLAEFRIAERVLGRLRAWGQRQERDALAALADGRWLALFHPG
jgi:hypothetical protein